MSKKTSNPSGKNKEGVLKHLVHFRLDQTAAALLEQEAAKHNTSPGLFVRQLLLERYKTEGE